MDDATNYRYNLDREAKDWRFALRILRQEVKALGFIAEKYKFSFQDEYLTKEVEKVKESCFFLLSAGDTGVFHYSSYCMEGPYFIVEGVTFSQLRAIRHLTKNPRNYFNQFSFIQQHSRGICCTAEHMLEKAQWTDSKKR